MKAEAREWVMGKWKTLEFGEEVVAEAHKVAETLIQEADVVVFITIEDGIPIAKAMYPAYKDGISHIWFNTDATSKRLQQIKENPVATVYCYEKGKIEGLMLVGKAYVETEHIWRERLWKEDFKEGYVGGIEDSDYQVMRFDAEWCNCFSQSKSITFSLDKMVGTKR